MTAPKRLRLAEVLRLSPVSEPRFTEIPPLGDRLCRAAYCTFFTRHAGRHTNLHYLLLDDHEVLRPPGTVCSCHPLDASDAGR